MHKYASELSAAGPKDIRVEEFHVKSSSCITGTK
jgi:hypothetical protein